MTRTEANALWHYINYLKRGWRNAGPGAGDWKTHFAQQAWRDALFGVIYHFRLKLDADMTFLPDDLDLRKVVRKGGELSTSVFTADELACLVDKRSTGK